MKKLFLLLLIGLLLAACGQSGAAENSEGDSEPAVEAVPEPATVEDESEEVVATDTAVINDEDPPSADDPVAEDASAPVGDATEIRASDWTKGADDPLVTIIEYGDFQ